MGSILRCDILAMIGVCIGARSVWADCANVWNDRDRRGARIGGKDSGEAERLEREGERRAASGERRAARIKRAHKNNPPAGGLVGWLRIRLSVCRFVGQLASLRIALMTG